MTTTTRERELQTEPRDAQSQAEPETSASLPLTSQELHDEIATTAYYIAERRGFIPGYADDDWLAAEAEVLDRHARAIES